MRDKLCHFVDAVAARGRDESGVALIMVLLVSAILLGIGLALSTNSMLELDIVSNHQREAVAWYAAQTGLEQSINGFRTNYTTNNLPADGTVEFNWQPCPIRDSTRPETTRSRWHAATPRPVHPYHPILSITQSRASAATFPPTQPFSPRAVTLTQTLAVSPQTLANWTLFYNLMDYDVWFQTTFTLAGRLAVNDLRGVNCSLDGTTVNGDFYSAGPIRDGIPTVSGNITENGGQISFPQTIEPFSSGATTSLQLRVRPG